MFQVNQTSFNLANYPTSPAHPQDSCRIIFCDQDEPYKHLLAKDSCRIILNSQNSLSIPFTHKKQESKHNYSYTKIYTQL